MLLQECKKNIHKWLSHSVPLWNINKSLIKKRNCCEWRNEELQGTRTWCIMGSGAVSLSGMPDRSDLPSFLWDWLPSSSMAAIERVQYGSIRCTVSSSSRFNKLTRVWLISSPLDTYCTSLSQTHALSLHCKTCRYIEVDRLNTPENSRFTLLRFGIQPNWCLI